MSLTLKSASCSALKGTIRVPGDKSISHRSIMLGSIANGVTEVKNFLHGEDNLATLNAFKAMGVSITQLTPDHLKIEGVGLHGLKEPAHTLDLGNSGTAIRLMTGLLAGQRFKSCLTGDASLQKRPMGRVANPLAEMGANITLTAGDKPPIHIQPSTHLHGVHYTLPIPSAQIKSSILLAGLYAQGKTEITEPAPSRDHTERLLKAMGYPIEYQYPHISLTGGHELTGRLIDVPSDLSSAAFFMIAALIVPGSDVVIEHVGMNPTRTGVVTILKKMGADIEILNARETGGEPVADLRIRHQALQGIHIPSELVPLAIDEFPILLIAAACAKGETVLTGAEELRVKESDRIAAMVDGLNATGIQALATPDGCRVQGGTFEGGVVDSLGDHRIAMAFAIAGAVSKQAITIHDCDNIATSFPTFTTLTQQLGMQVVCA